MGKKIKNLWKKQGFTLVELIIVIAIIVVLAVSAFMMLTKWLGNSRDSRRIADANTIQSALTIHMGDLDNSSGLLPMPDDAVELSISGVVLGYQGNFGIDTISKMDNIQKVPLDPSDSEEYTYYMSADKKKFQIMVYLEKDEEVSGIIGNKVYATDYSNRYEEVYGYDLGVFTDTNKTPIQNLSITGLDLTTAVDNYNVVFKEDTLESVSTMEILSSIIIRQERSDLVLYDDSLVAYWDMETMTGVQLKDLSKYENHGTLTGGIQVGQVNGRKGKATLFDGVDDYIKIVDDVSMHLKTSEYTMSTWMYIDSLGNYYLMEGTFGKPLFQIGVNGNLLIVIRNSDDSSRNSYSTSDNIITPGWQYLTVTYDKEYIRFYMNGEFLSKRAQTYDIGGNNSSSWRLGGRQTVWLDGILDEVRIYNRGLSSAEVKALYEISK